ncbi:histone H4 [Schizosaccharomyces octosporus yFS286]|uniref:Histone H4 n=1 Tax=Schizosaccharomyces octosporus (strain yFS286) TaxID=483514 RepID=S9RB42_SCHOY|nr:histone H4 [Schizosaccharomyces octosporus yFS286]EPX75360.1 histone H4 [Schizosaccharomyces octosporus yFS286]
MNNPVMETPIRKTSFNHLVGTLSQKKLFTPSRNRSSLPSAQRTVTPHKQRALARKSNINKRKSNIHANKTPRDILRTLSRALAKQPIPSPAESSNGSSQKKKLRRTSSTMPIAPPSRKSLSGRQLDRRDSRSHVEEADLTTQSIEIPRRYSARVSDIFTPESRKIGGFQNPFANSKLMENDINRVQESALSNSPDHLLDVGDEIPVFRLPVSDYETADPGEDTPSADRASMQLNQYQSPIFTFNSDLLENDTSFSGTLEDELQRVTSPVHQPRLDESFEQQALPDAESSRIDKLQRNISPAHEPELDESFEQLALPDAESSRVDEMQGNTSPIQEPLLGDPLKEPTAANQETITIDENISLLDKDGFKKPKQKSRKVSSKTLPDSNLRKLANAYSRKSVSSSVIEELSSVSEDFFKQVTEDLSAYADHAGRKTIETNDACLLLKRQRKIHDKVSLMALQRSYLSREIKPVSFKKR